MDNSASPAAIQKSIWDGRIPLEIVLAPSESRSYDKTDAYLVLTAHAIIALLVNLINIHQPGLIPTRLISSLVATKASSLFLAISDRAWISTP
jgi:hypothetical protein